MVSEPTPAPRTWRRKFRDAFRGLRVGVRSQSSFVVHFSFAVAVAAAAALLHMDRREWYVLLLCITVVLTAETFNSALESMARAITREQNAHLRDALDIGSAAVLVAAIGAALIGILVFVHRAMEMIG